jgi:hypothetical protein
MKNTIGIIFKDVFHSRLDPTGTVFERNAINNDNNI